MSPCVSTPSFLKRWQTRRAVARSWVLSCSNTSTQQRSGRAVQSTSCAGPRARCVGVSIALSCCSMGHRCRRGARRASSLGVDWPVSELLAFGSRQLQQRRGRAHLGLLLRGKPDQSSAVRPQAGSAGVGTACGPSELVPAALVVAWGLASDPAQRRSVSAGTGGSWTDRASRPGTLLVQGAKQRAGLAAGPKGARRHGRTVHQLETSRSSSARSAGTAPSSSSPTTSVDSRATEAALLVMRSIEQRGEDDTVCVPTGDKARPWTRWAWAARLILQGPSALGTAAPTGAPGRAEVLQPRPWRADRAAGGRRWSRPRSPDWWGT